MLIMPPGHHKEVAARRTLTSRERSFVLLGVAIALVLAVVIVAAVSKSTPASGHGCVYVTITSSTGALTIQGCGARARRICAGVQVPGTYVSAARAEVIAECRKAGVSPRRLA